MEHITLGKTLLDVSIAGLGCGGDSHLGLDTGGTEQNAAEIVNHAYELGVTLFDTADEYGTEELLGRVLAPVRSEVVICTKTKPLRPDGSLLDADGLRDNVHASLRRLGTQYIDLFYLHMVRARHYDHCNEVLWPILDRLRTEGVIRHIGITEGSRSDPFHETLSRAVRDTRWEAVMCAFNPFNSSARQLLFPATIESSVGVVAMCAARGPLSHGDQLRRLTAELLAEGQLEPDEIDLSDPLGFLVDHGARSVIEACYRYARHQPGCHVVLTGTGNLAHLEENIAAISGPPLPDRDLDRLDRLFGHLQRMTRD